MTSRRPLNEQKQYDMGVKMDAIRAEMQGQIDRLSKEVRDLQGRSARPETPLAPPAAAMPS